MKTLTLITLSLALAGTLNAQDDPKTPKRGEGKGRPEPCEELREARKARFTAMRERHEAQKEETDAFREGLKDAPIDERIARTLDFRTDQHQDNVAFQNEQYAKAVAAVQACEHLPDEKKQAFLAKMEERHAKGQAHHEEIHKEVIAFLNELKASDATPEEKMEAWEAFRKETRAKMQAQRKEHGRKGRKGRGPKAEKTADIL